MNPRPSIAERRRNWRRSFFRGAYYFFLAFAFLALGYATYIFVDARAYQAIEESKFSNRRATPGPHLVATGDAIGGDTGEVNPGVLQHFSKATGGVAYFPDSKNTVASISTQIARDLREQYTLGFAPEKANNAHAFRKIEVKVSAPGQGKLHARTRAGYSAAGDKSSDAEAEKGAE